MQFTVTPQAIRAQVGKILASEGFLRSKRMQRFLEFIVEETLAGRADELGEYGIGTAVFDRPSDFEPAVDPVVRIEARRLRAKLFEYYRLPQAGEVLIDVPKGAYVPVFTAVAAERPIAAIETPRRLAVLPFEVLCTAPESANQGRAIGMSLTANLTNLDGVQTVAHGYVSDQSMRESVSELNLSHVVHGSLVKWTDRWRITVNLIRVQEGTQLWAREYDCESSELPRLQREIAAHLRVEVSARLGLRQTSHSRLALAA